MNNLVLKYSLSLKARKFLDNELFLYFPEGFKLKFLRDKFSACYSIALIKTCVLDIYDNIFSMSKNSYCGTNKCGSSSCLNCYDGEMFIIENKEELNLFIHYLNEVVRNYGQSRFNR